MSTLAVFIVLGGGAYAATKLPKNSVGNAQLKNNAVTNRKIKNNAVTTKKVKNGTLLRSDFKKGQLPRATKGAAGASGAAGDTGSQGAAGPQGTPGDLGPPGPPGNRGSPGFALAYFDKGDDTLHVNNIDPLASVTIAGNVVLLGRVILSYTQAGTEPVTCTLYESGNSGTALDSYTTTLSPNVPQTALLMATIKNAANAYNLACNDALNAVAGTAPTLVAFSVDQVKP
jgi:hypothetical protein